MTFIPGEIDMSRQYEELWNQGSLQCVNTTNMSIPPDPNNMDYARYLEWKKQGGVPTIKDVTHYPDLAERRQAEYDKRGATIDALTVALWEKNVEGRPEDADRIQVIREQVKLDIPKEIKPVIREWKKQGGVPVIRSSKAQK